MMKRLVPVLIGAGACLALASPAFAQQRLTVATYGGNWGEAQKACILDPFAKASGVQVIQETSVSTVTYSKLKQQKGNPSIDIAWIDGTHYSHMCGHGTIAVSMGMVALGMVPKGGDGHTTIRFETTAGPVASEVAHEGDRVEWCRFENVPAYVVAQDIPLDVPGLGRVSADVVWGGNYFGIIDIRGKGLEINPGNGTRLSQIGVAAREMLREKIKLQHPTQGNVSNFNLVTLWHEEHLPGAFYKNVHVFSAGQLDRSPGGTGTSAMMAMFHARGQLALNQPIQSEGLLGTGTFEGCLIGQTMLGKQPAVRPTVKGKANIIGTARWLIDPEDPVGSGFLVS